MANNTQLDTSRVPISTSVVTVTLSSANIQSMHTTGILLIAAQGAHTCIMVHDVFNEYIFNTTTYVNGDPPQLQYGSTGADSNAHPLLSYTNNFFTNPASTFLMTNGSEGGGISVGTTSGVINTGVYISNFTAAYSGGNSTAKITLVYSVITTTS